MSERPMDVTSTADAQQKVSDVKVVGNPDVWRLICKASSAKQGWMRSTKAMQLDSGVLVHVSSIQGGVPAEALAFVPGASVRRDGNGGWEII